MAEKHYHLYCVILSDGSREDAVATGLTWSHEGPDRILKLEGVGYKDDQGKFINPLGVHRMEEYVGLPKGEAVPEGEDDG